MNVEIESKIQNIIQTIGTEETTGLARDYFEKNGEYLTEKLEGDKKNERLTSLLRDQARKIKLNTKVFDVPVYDSGSLKNDLGKVDESSQLSEIDKDVLMSVISEQPKPSLRPLPISQPNLSGFQVAVENLISREISQSRPIQELLDDPSLQEWVRIGLEKHHGKRDNCAFCGNSLPSDLWERLGQHFVKESENLRTEINSMVAELQSAADSLKNFIKFRKDDFYFSSQDEFDRLMQQWEGVSAAYIRSILSLLEALELRSNNIFKPYHLNDLSDNSLDIISTIELINSLISKNNLYSDNLTKEQKGAREKLRLNEVYSFARTIDYPELLKEIKHASESTAARKNAADMIKGRINQLEEERRALEQGLKDESRGAALVNTYLKHFFGHEELKLEAVDSDSNVKFKITRNQNDAKNLSEGECSLISFCYFIARLKDQIDSAENAVVVYIDDPISSLDNNHTYFIFSLIESVISKPNKYRQFFISTHSLDFLKYVKRLTKPGRDDRNTGYFMMQKQRKSSVLLVNSPAYLRKYITEFNYLFSEIFACACENLETIEYKHQYGFGNNLRKFLESYLFFKMPDHEIGISERLRRFFEDDVVSYNLVNRVANELSHLEEQFDRGVVPVDFEEIRKVARIVIKKLIACDISQYNALCKSIGVDGSIFLDAPDDDGSFSTTAETSISGDDGPF